MKTPKTKLEVIPSRKEVILSKDYSAATNVFKGLTKVLLGIPTDPILNFFGKSRQESFQKMYAFTAPSDL